MFAQFTELDAAVQAAGLEALPQKKIPENRYLRWGGNDHAWLVWSEHHTKKGEPYTLAVFGSWRTGEKHQWCSLGEKLSPEQRIQVQADWEALNRDLQKRQAEGYAKAKAVAARRFAAADPHGFSAYLERKVGFGRVAFDLRVEADGTLLVPILDWTADGSLEGQSVQAIAPDGEKRFLPGGKVRGGFCIIGWPIVNGNRFAVCEGVATGISIHHATGLPVVCAFSAGNLRPVLDGLRQRYADNQIMVCADNDRWTPGNPGLTAARALIDSHRVTVRYPEFGDDEETIARKPTDFNDLANREDLCGLEAVRHQILGEPVYEAPADDVGISLRPTAEIARETLTSSGSRKRPAQSHVSRQLAESLRSQMAWDEARQGWREYQSGEWKVVSLPTVKRMVQKAMDAAFTDGYSDSYVSGVIHLLANYLAVDEWNPQVHTALPMTNGVLELTSRTLRPHTQEDHWTWQLPFAYEPSAQPGPVVDWLSEACGGHADRVEILRAWVNAVLLGRTDLQKYLELIGPGGSGKSTFLGLLEALIGAAHVQATELKHLEGRFETSGLLGKRLLLVTDQQQYQGEVSTLKSIVGQDPVRIEHKYRGEITSQRIPALVTLAANQAIRASDYSSGMERRRIFIPFDTLIDPSARRELRSEFEPYLSGVLNWALALPAERVTELLRDPLCHAPSLVAASHEHQSAINPLLQWAREELTVDPAGFAPWGLAQKNRSRDGDHEFLYADRFLYANYREFCVTHGMSSLSSMRFQSGLLDLLRAQLRIDVVATRCHSGEHRNRHGLRGIRIAKFSDAPLIPEIAPVPSTAPVAPAQDFSAAHVTHGNINKCASAPVAPLEKTSKQSGFHAEPPVKASTNAPSSNLETLEVVLIDATGALAQREEKQTVTCANSHFEAGASGATVSAPDAWPAAFDLPDGAPAMLPLLSRASGFSEADLLAGRLDTEEDWDRLTKAVQFLAGRYLCRKADLAQIIDRVDAAYIRRLDQSPQ